MSIEWKSNDVYYYEYYTAEKDDWKFTIAGQNGGTYDLNISRDKLSIQRNGFIFLEAAQKFVEDRLDIFEELW